MRDNGGFVLDARQRTLAARLASAGFRTGGFVGAYVLDRRWGIARGFDTYVDDFDVEKARGPVPAGVERRANDVADRALAWLETAAASRFFAWVHFYDAHSPYDPPEPYRTRFAARPYAGEVAFVDSQVGRLIAFLEDRRLLDKTIVVAVGDHGESLGEHDESTHGFFVYRSVLRVPSPRIFTIRSASASISSASRGSFFHRPSMERRPAARATGGPARIPRRSAVAHRRAPCG